MDVFDRLLKRGINKDVPVEVYMDVLGRIMDWMNAGGSGEDEYINKQFDYLDRATKLFEERKMTDETVS